MVAYELTMFSLSDIFLLTFLVTGVSWRRRLLFIFFMIATVQKLFGEFLILMVPTTSFLPSNNGFPNNFLHLMEAYLLVLVGGFGELGIQVFNDQVWSQWYILNQIHVLHSIILPEVAVSTSTNQHIMLVGPHRRLIALK